MKIVDWWARLNAPTNQYIDNMVGGLSRSTPWKLILISMDGSMLLDIARRLGTSEKGLERVLGSVRVQVGSDRGSGDVESEKVLELGLNVLRILRGKKLSESEQTIVRDCVLEYERSAPKVKGWLTSGDFNPRKVPDRITPALLIHGCRTAGRLRAKILRQLNALSIVT